MKVFAFVLVSLLICGTNASSNKATNDDWQTWIEHFGHDTFLYPQWVKDQMKDCSCHLENCAERIKDSGEWKPVDIYSATALTYCVAKQWLLSHMPEFDKYFLPPSVSVDGISMFDDNIAFVLMAQKAAPWTDTIPMPLQLDYLLPYATFHESRVNWRPLMFARYFSLVANSSSTVDAMSKLVGLPYPHNTFTNFSDNTWPAYPGKNMGYGVQWASSTSPPVTSPFDFAAYGYGSCTAWSTLLAYIARAVGIPARQAGTPCWNSLTFKGLAKDNANVSQCWNGGVGNTVGGKFLNNHNWVEYWDDVNARWVFQNVPPATTEPDQGLCNYSEETGCNYDPVKKCAIWNQGGPGAASQDHEIFSVTWAFPGEEHLYQHSFKGKPVEYHHDRVTNGTDYNGGPIINVKDLKLTNGEAVSPLVWSPRLASPLGTPLKDIGLRVVNRTTFYRCRLPAQE